MNSCAPLAGFDLDCQVGGTGAVAALEAKLRAWYGKRYAVTVCNATQGLFAVARALELAGRSFVTPALNWPGAISAFQLAGARPSFADVNEMTLGLCPDATTAAITPRTFALLAVDLDGVPADDAALRRIADAFGLWYVHDAAESLGATIAGRAAGSMAHVIVVSFGPGKPIAAGEGGAVLTDDSELYERIVTMTQHHERHLKVVGPRRATATALNARIHPIAAALAVEGWDSAFERLRMRRQWCERVLHQIHGSGLGSAPNYAAAHLEPTFFRLSALSRAPDATRVLSALNVEHPNLLMRVFGLTPLAASDAARARRAETPVALAQSRRRVLIGVR